MAGRRGGRQQADGARFGGGSNPAGMKDTSRSRYNAIRHGILARSVVLEGEDVRQYEDMRSALAADMHAVGMVEEMWVDQLASLYWRLGRLQRAEANPSGERFAGLTVEQIHRYEVSLRNEMRTVLADLHRARERRRERYARSRRGADDESAAAPYEQNDAERFWSGVAERIDADTPDEGPVAAECAVVEDASAGEGGEAEAGGETGAPASEGHYETNCTSPPPQVWHSAVQGAGAAEIRRDAGPTRVSGPPSAA